MFDTVLVANRGEIACRVLRTLRRLGVRSVAVYSDPDAGAKHVREADTAVRIGEAPAPVSYLTPAAIVQAAREAGAEAVHPGYGFLSESPSFARAVNRAGLTWIGPPPDIMDLTGDKVAARDAFDRLGFPVLHGAGPFDDPRTALDAARELGFPVMVKAVAGGGGIGMGVAMDEQSLTATVETASARGARFFADPSVYLERFVAGARHVEVQVIADGSRAVHLYERECSIQRRHQKVIEETPSTALNGERRREMCQAAAAAMAGLGYVGAGTVECVVEPAGAFWFLEVNARLQVEHPITELTTGLDLVEHQLRLAAGDGMSFDAPPPREGHAIELRVYAEDPRTFLPSPGRIASITLPDGVRADMGYDGGDEVPMFYDPLIGKLAVLAADRQAAIDAAAAAVSATRIEGIKTNLPTHLAVLEDERFVAGLYDTGLLGA